MNEHQQLDFIDILTLVSFALQLQNQTKLIDIQDVQKEVDRAIDLINSHLEDQDRMLKELVHESNQKAVKDD